jgi:uncharacterized hydrophobic protein (TIGR00341 family)
MTLRLIQVTLPAERKRSLENIADNYKAVDIWWTPKNEDGRRTVTILVDRSSQQDILDSIQNNLQDEDNWRAVLIPVEASLPKDAIPENEHPTKQKFHWRKSLTREELYQEVAGGSQGDRLYYMMVVLSTIVAAVGLLQDNVAFVIAAMVIAPLLNPNLALTFGTALGDKNLIFTALTTSLGGLVAAIIPCIAVGYFYEINMGSEQLMERTTINFASMIVALASGAAAVLSMTTGVSSALVGVMVSVALLPPAAALGLFLGHGEFRFAWDSSLLLMTNVVCIGLSSQIVLAIMGIRPRKFIEQKKAMQSHWIQAAICLALLAFISAVILLSDVNVTENLRKK